MTNVVKQVLAESAQSLKKAIFPDIVRRFSHYSFPLVRLH